MSLSVDIALLKQQVTKDDGLISLVFLFSLYYINK
jgi:hypothetical protein